MSKNGPTDTQTRQTKYLLFAKLRRLLKDKTKSNTSAQRHCSQYTAFLRVLLFEIFCPFNACDIANIFFFAELGRLYRYESRSGTVCFVRQWRASDLLVWNSADTTRKANRLLFLLLVLLPHYIHNVYEASN